MPCWVRSLRGVVVVRDGTRISDPVRRVGGAPVLFERLPRARLAADPALEIVEAPTEQSAMPPRPPDRLAPSEPSPSPEPAGNAGRRRRRGRR
jgi:hypothetical protein